MHRSYQPLYPTQSKLLQKKWDEAAYERHRIKLASMKSNVDSRPPETYFHNQISLKKMRLQDERQAKIDEENRKMLDKISHIIKSDAAVDNHNHNFQKKNINKEKQVRCYNEISRQNEKIANRLVSIEPLYSRDKYNMQWDQTQQIMNRLTSYPNEKGTRAQNYNSRNSVPNNCQQ